VNKEVKVERIRSSFCFLHAHTRTHTHTHTHAHMHTCTQSHFLPVAGLAEGDLSEYRKPVLASLAERERGERERERERETCKHHTDCISMKERERERARETCKHHTDCISMKERERERARERHANTTLTISMKERERERARELLTMSPLSHSYRLQNVMSHHSPHPFVVLCWRILPFPVFWSHVSKHFYLFINTLVFAQRCRFFYIEFQT